MMCSSVLWQTSASHLQYQWQKEKNVVTEAMSLQWLKGSQVDTLTKVLKVMTKTVHYKENIETRNLVTEVAFVQWLKAGQVNLVDQVGWHIN